MNEYPARPGSQCRAAAGGDPAAEAGGGGVALQDKAGRDEARGGDLQEHAAAAAGCRAVTPQSAIRTPATTSGAADHRRRSTHQSMSTAARPRRCRRRIRRRLYR